MVTPPIIPLPLQFETLPGQCRLPGSLLIGCSGEGALEVGMYLASYLTERLQMDAQAHAAEEPSRSHRIYLSCSDRPELAHLANSQEAYNLRVAEHSIYLQAKEPHGLFNGVQSLIQLLPPKPVEDTDVLLDCLQARKAGRCTVCSMWITKT
jgi:hexosaminidase